MVPRHSRPLSERTGGVFILEKSFGTKIGGENYRERVGAYAVPIDDLGRVALVEAPAAGGEERSLFLIGGGMEPGETPDACIRRESLEETGRAISVGEMLCTGDEYLFAPADRRCLHVIGHCFRAVLGAEVQEPIEKDHVLTWMPVEECDAGIFLQYQAWAVRTAWKNKKEEKKP